MTEKKITIYSSEYCGFCWRAKALLDTKGLAYEEISVDGKPEVRAHMTDISGRTSVPQIWIGEKHVGGCSELYALDDAGELDPLVSL